MKIEPGNDDHSEFPSRIFLIFVLAKVTGLISYVVDLDPGGWSGWQELEIHDQIPESDPMTQRNEDYPSDDEKDASPELGEIYKFKNPRAALCSSQSTCI